MGQMHLTLSWVTENTVANQEFSVLENQDTPADLFMTTKRFSPIVMNIGVRRGDKGKTFLSNGTMLPGIHDFGIIKRREEIQVTKGCIKINGTAWRPVNGIRHIYPGDSVEFETEVVSDYSCHFPDFE